MPVSTLHLRSNVKGKEPVAGNNAGQLPVGSIGINFNADEPFLCIQDAAGVIRRIAGVAVGTAAPATPTAGEFWLDTSATDRILKVFDGTAWAAAGKPIPDATTAVKGIVQLADAAAITAGTAGHVVDAAQLKAATPAATTAAAGLVRLADAAAVTAGTAGRVVDAAQLKAADHWTRTGTVLAPKTTGDVVEVSAGTAAAPVIQVGTGATTKPGLYSPGADQLAVSTGGTGRVHVDANGHITVGNASQSGVGLLTGGKSLSLPFSSDINGNTTGSSVTIGAKIVSLSGMTGPSLFTAASLAIHQTGSTEGVGEFRFSTGDGAGVLTERLRLTNDGHLRLAAGSKGVQFGGDTAAANALNDYEEGTFVPRVEGSSTPGVGTYTTQKGRYTKIGNRVFFTLTVQWTAHTGGGTLFVRDLPFAANAASDACFTVSFGDLTYPAGSRVQADIYPGATIIIISTAQPGAAVTNLVIDTAALIRVSGHYSV